MTAAPLPGQTGHDRLSNREMLSYSIGAVGSNVIYALVATYLFVFYTDSFGLKLAAVGTLFLLVRFWDAIFDVLIGIMVDNTQTRMGKFRPYLLFGGFLTSISAAACFLSPNFSESGKLIYAYCTYITWSMSYALADIPYWSLTPAMTDDPVERTRVTAMSRTGAQVGYWIVSVGTLPAVAWMNSRDISIFGLDGWAMAGVLAGVICFLCFVTTFVGVKEKRVLPRHEKQTLKAAVHLFTQNSPLRYLMMACFSLEAVSAIRGTFAVYYMKNYLGSASLVPWYMAVNFSLVIVGCIAAPAITRRFGKVNTARYSYLLVGVLAIAMYVTKDYFYGILAFTAFIGFFDGVSNIGRMSCLADCVEYGEWKTGNRAEGMVFSTNIFKTKVAGAVSGAVTGYFLAWIAYQPPIKVFPNGAITGKGEFTVDTIPAGIIRTDLVPTGIIPTKGMVIEVIQSAGTLHWIALFFTVILGVASILAILPLFRYELTEKRFAEISADLKKRKQES